MRVSKEETIALLTFTNQQVFIVAEVQFRIDMKRGDGIQELVQVINAKVLRKLFRDFCFCENVLHHRNGANGISFLDQDRLIDRGEVLEQVNSFIRQFHNHWL